MQVRVVEEYQYWSSQWSQHYSAAQIDKLDLHGVSVNGVNGN